LEIKMCMNIVIDDRLCFASDSCFKPLRDVCQGC
jgi:hypothetical protein